MLRKLTMLHCQEPAADLGARLGSACAREGTSQDLPPPGCSALPAGLQVGQEAMGWCFGRSLLCVPFSVL